MKKKLIAIAAAGFGFAAIQGCAVEQGASYETEDVGVVESALTGSASLTVTGEWQGGYCANLKITNGLPESTSKWMMRVDLKDSKVNNTWNSTLPLNSVGVVNVSGVTHNTVIASGGFAEFGFCASRPNTSTAKPVLLGWNVNTTVYASCSTNAGTNPTKAALAVAMATELGSWDSLGFLRVVNGEVTLTDTANAKCNAAAHKCRNLKGLLELQKDGNTSDQNLFNPTVFRQEMIASFDRQRNHLINNSANPPPVHQLTLVSGPTNIGKVQNGVSASCGPHYIYKVTKNGVNLTSTEANNLRNALCFFGEACGDNPYIGYTTAGLSACPSGATCVAIDPTDGDNSSTATTTQGSLPKYPANRIMDTVPSTLLGTGCMTTLDRVGTLQPRVGSTYLWCTPS